MKTKIFWNEEDYNHEKDGKVKRNSPSWDRTDNGSIMNINNTQIICHKCSSKKWTDTHEKHIKYCKDVARRFGFK